MTRVIKVNKNPVFTTQQQIDEENKQRRLSIGEILLTGSPAVIREMTKCHLDASVGRPLAPRRGEALYLLEVDYLVLERDFGEYMRFVQLRNMAEGGGIGTTRDEKMVAQYKEKIKQIIRRGSDHIRSAVTRAADWACVPPEMVAAVLQNENNPRANAFQQHGQAVERNIQSTSIFGFRPFGNRSTGLGNVKPDTLSEITNQVTKYYKRSLLAPTVKDTGQNRNIETDIFHAAAVIREGLNQAWSAGERSLNKIENKKYEYYPYFGGPITAEIAIRAMGHYNGWGGGALAYGQAAFKRIVKEKLYFLEAK